MKAAEEQCIEDMAQLMVSWGLPRTTGRVYGLLLLQSAPTDLDEMVALIDVSKSGASIAARQLVALGLARASGDEGHVACATKRSTRLMPSSLRELPRCTSSSNSFGRAPRLLRSPRLAVT